MFTFAFAISRCCLQLRAIHLGSVVNHACIPHALQKSISIPLTKLLFLHNVMLLLLNQCLLCILYGRCLDGGGVPAVLVGGGCLREGGGSGGWPWWLLPTEAVSWGPAVPGSQPALFWSHRGSSHQGLVSHQQPAVWRGTVAVPSMDGSGAMGNMLPSLGPLATPHQVNPLIPSSFQ